MFPPVPRPLALAAALCLGAGCRTDPLAPPAVVTPRLQWLQLAPIAVQDSGIVLVNALPLDSSFRLARNESARLRVETASGDIEELVLEHENCQRRPGQPSRCKEVALGMEDGYRAEPLRAYAEAINGRIYGISVSGRVAALRIFGGSLDAAQRTAKSWPGVRHAELNFLAFVDGPSAWTYALLGAAAPLDFAPAVPRDGHVQVRHGDRLTFTYQQPDGTSLTLSVVIN